jgi:hypothetical protein
MLPLGPHLLKRVQYSGMDQWTHVGLGLDLELGLEQGLDVRLVGNEERWGGGTHLERQSGQVGAGRPLPAAVVVCPVYQRVTLVILRVGMHVV